MAAAPFTTTFSKKPLIIAGSIALLIGVLGYVLLATRAAGQFSAVEVENGAVSAPAKIINDTSAISGKAVQFGAATNPTPTPEPTGKPTAANTGVIPGTQLTIKTGDQVFSKDNEVISGLDIRGNVQITGKNVTLKNSIIRSRSTPCREGTNGNDNTSMLWVRQDHSASALIENVELAPDFVTPCVDGMWVSNSTVSRSNIHDVVDGIKAFDNTIIKDSYFHDLHFFVYDTNQTNGGDGTHNDAVQTYEGNQNIKLTGNNIALLEKDNAAYQVTQDFGKKSTNLTIENNWLDGGGCTLNFAHKGGPTPMTGIYVRNNRFGRHSGYTDCPILISTKTVLSENTGNVWDDSSQPIPAPQQHD